MHGTPPPAPLRRRLEVSVRRDGDITVLRATGELDLAGSPRLATRLNDVIWRSTGDVVVELDVHMVDSTGLAVLLNALAASIVPAAGCASSARSPACAAPSVSRASRGSCG